MTSVQLLTPALFRATLDRAHASPRRRMNHNFHSGPQDNPHRFLNALLRGTYVQPHRHLDPPKAESFVILSGWALSALFDDEGRVTARYLIGHGEKPAGCPAGLPEGQGIDVAAGIWHTVAAVSEEVMCYEVKPGPWNPAFDKDFAPWAPREGDPRCEAYLDALLRGDPHPLR
jgi:cupin fold WbuC family metalloprotein